MFMTPFLSNSSLLKHVYTFSLYSHMEKNVSSPFELRLKCPLCVIILGQNL